MAELILVKIAPLGRTVTEVMIPAGSTVGTAISAASSSVNLNGYDDLRKNGKPTNTNEPVVPGDIITLIPAIRGGRN